MEEYPLENLELETKGPNMSKWEACLVFCGVAAAMTGRNIINAEILKSFDEATEVLNIKKEEDEDQKPPKPPSRPNIPIYGRAALYEY